MKKKKQIKDWPGRPPVYAYTTMSVGEINVSNFETKDDRLNARCAAHMIGMRNGKKFYTTNRLTDYGKFELTVKRVL